MRFTKQLIRWDRDINEFTYDSGEPNSLHRNSYVESGYSLKNIFNSLRKSFKIFFLF